MIKKLIQTKFLSGLLALSILATSFCGIFAGHAYAADSDNPVIDESIKDESSNNSILAGIAAIGLITALSHHEGSSNNTSMSNKTTSSSQSQSGSTVSSSDETLAISLMNQDRSSNGLSALKVNSQLTRLAENYAQDMINRNFFSHYNPEGQSPFDRMNQAGISYTTAGENLAKNTSVASAEQAFMNSSGHRANILNSSYTEIGIGVVRSPDGSVYVVQEFIGK